MSTIRTRAMATALAMGSLAGAHSAWAQTEAESAMAIGASTRNLLDMQRSGRQAGPELPMLGSASVLAYQRYLQAKKYPVPEYFSESLNTTKSSK